MHHLKCPLCGEEHNPKKVEFLNIEEDAQGRDVMTFTCPVKMAPAKSYVFKGRGNQ